MSPHLHERPGAHELAWQLFHAARPEPLHLVRGDDETSAVTYRLRAAAGRPPEDVARESWPRRVVAAARVSWAGRAVEVGARVGWAARRWVAAAGLAVVIALVGVGAAAGVVEPAGARGRRPR